MIPLVEEAIPKDDVIDDLMRQASGGVDRLAGLTEAISGLGPRVQHYEQLIMPQLPRSDATRRIAHNYGIIISLAELVSQCY